MVIKLVRHGESESNAGETTIREAGDHAIPLTELGRQQAGNAGRRLGAEFLGRALIYCSPYRRTRTIKPVAAQCEARRTPPELVNSAWSIA